MSLFATLILSAAAGAVPLTPAPQAPTRWHRFVAAAHAMDVPTTTLFTAVVATPPRKGGPRATLYCFDDRLSRPDAPRTICRTKREWEVLGLDPLTE